MSRTRSIVVAALLTLSPLYAEAGCGLARSGDAGHDQRVNITLENEVRNDPVYFWHDSSTYALLYFHPEDFVTHLEALVSSDPTANTLFPALLDNIKMDLPLKQTTDLFRYTLIDQRFDSAVNAVIADLMKDGKVMLDQWIFVDAPAKSIVMVSRSDASGAEDARWFCTNRDDILFRIGDASFDQSP